MGKSDAGSFISKDASGHPSDTLMNDMIFTHRVHCLTLVVKALWAEKASLNRVLVNEAKFVTADCLP